MTKAYMIEFELPEAPSETFFSLIPRQRYMINNLMAEGRVKSYSLALDRSRLWVIANADSEFELMEMLADLPLSPFMEPTICELMFHNSHEVLAPFSLN
jgi:muconolactone delta-isomerase